MNLVTAALRCPVAALSVKLYQAVFLAALITLSHTSIAADSQPVTISCHPAYPPVMFVKDNVPMGIAVDVAKAALNSLGVPYELVNAGAWKRVQQSAKVGKLDLIAGLYFNTDREKYLDYSLPIMDDPTVIFVWQGKEFEFKTLEDLIGKQGTTNLGESFGTRVDAFIKDHLSVQRVVQADMNYKFLELGRVDYMIFGLYPGRSQALQYGYGDKIVTLPTPVATEKFYLAMSKKSPHKALLKKIDEYIKQQVTPSVIRQLSEKNTKIYIGR